MPIFPFNLTPTEFEAWIAGDVATSKPWTESDAAQFATNQHFHKNVIDDLRNVWTGDEILSHLQRLDIRMTSYSPNVTNVHRVADHVLSVVAQPADNPTYSQFYANTAGRIVTVIDSTMTFRARYKGTVSDMSNMIWGVASAASSGSRPTDVIGVESSGTGNEVRLNVDGTLGSSISGSDFTAYAVYKIVMKAASVELYIDDVLETTITTGIPTTLQRPYFDVQAAGAGVANAEVVVDMLKWLVDDATVVSTL